MRTNSQGASNIDRASFIGGRQTQKQSRLAEYDRLTALPLWARTWGNCPVILLIARADGVATKLGC
jgi:hypothetical protein